MILKFIFLILEYFYNLFKSEIPLRGNFFTCILMEFWSKSFIFLIKVTKHLSPPRNKNIYFNFLNTHTHTRTHAMNCLKIVYKI